MSEMTASLPPSFNATPESPGAAVAHRRPKTRNVASRYLESTSASSSLFQSSSQYPKRCQSPTNDPAVTNRPQSTTVSRRGSLDRRGGGGGEVSAAERMLLASGRSLFASFQADSYRANEKRSKLNSSSPPVTPRRGRVEKRKTTSTATKSRSLVDQQEKSKLSEQWPRSLRPSFLSKSVDFTDAKKKPRGSCNGVARALENPLNVDLEKTVRSYSMISVDSLALSSKGVYTTRSQLFPKREQIGRPASPGIVRGISPSRGVVTPRGISPSGRMMSPLRVRSTLSNSTPLTLSFAVDAKKEKNRENGVADDAHLLRLLHNRLLEWRFANARANAVITAQKMRTEKRLYNAWISISKLYDSVRAKRLQTQRLKLNLKLISILNRQMKHLEEWLLVDRDYTCSLVGATEALRGSTLCLPVDFMATVNVQSVKDAICSAVDVMQAMASSICLLLPKVGKISCLTAELGRVNVMELEMVDVCRDLLNTISVLQVTECSLKIGAIQLLNKNKV